MKIYLAGEGANEIGGLAGDPVRRNGEPGDGTLGALARRVARVPVEVVGGRAWRLASKLGARTGFSGDGANLAALVLDAKDHEAEVLVAVRDRDGDREREADFNAARAVLDGDVSKPAIVAGMAVERLEAWIAALKGVSKSETKGTKAIATALKSAGVELKSSADYVAAVEAADLDQLPADAHSLKAWLDQARAALTP